VLTTVTSQASDFPPCHGIKVSPSGRLPSCLTKPDGSLVAGMLAEHNILYYLVCYKNEPIL